MLQNQLQPWQLLSGLRVFSVSARPAAVSAVEPAGPGVSRRSLDPVGGGIVVVEDLNNGIHLALPASDIRSVTAFDLNTKVTKSEEVTTRTKRLTFDFGTEHANKPLAFNLLYFTEGIRWIPAYRLSGDLQAKGQLDLQGEIVNDAEDITEAALDLVVGVANFRFKNTVSPLSLERAMRNVVAQAAPNISNANFYQNQAVVLSNSDVAATADRPAGAPAYSAPEMGGDAEQDLFVYSLGEFTLAKGARAAIPIWSSDVGIQHVYTFDTEIKRHAGNQQPARTGESPLKISENKFWHQLELSNNSTVPWTTGPTLVMRGNVPVAQELLTYTSRGTSTPLPLTVATDMRAVPNEVETCETRRRFGITMLTTCRSPNAGPWLLRVTGVSRVAYA